MKRIMRGNQWVASLIESMDGHEYVAPPIVFDTGGNIVMGAEVVAAIAESGIAVNHPIIRNATPGEVAELDRVHCSYVPRAGGWTGVSIETRIPADPIPIFTCDHPGCPHTIAVIGDGDHNSPPGLALRWAAEWASAGGGGWVFGWQMGVDADGRSWPAWHALCPAHNPENDY